MRDFACWSASIVITIAVLTVVQTSSVLAAEPKMKDSEKSISVGLVEHVVLIPWGITLPARIDTGAATSSLDARDLEVHDDVAEFSLPEKYGGKRLRVPVVGWKIVRSAESREKRPIVEMDLCLGPKVIRTRVNLNDRSRMRYPLIVGRNTLSHHFVVDCMKSFCTPPACSGTTSK